MKNESQSPWHSNRFLTRLQTAAKGGYIPRVRRPKKLWRPPGQVVGQLSQPGIGIDDLVIDLIAEKDVLLERHGRSDRALGYLYAALGAKMSPRHLKPATVGRIGGALAKHAGKLAEIRGQLTVAERQIQVVARIRNLLVLASLPGWETFGGIRIGDDGKICAEETGLRVESPFPQDHAVIQTGLHVALILAGDDRPEFTGIRGEMLPFADSSRGVNVPFPAEEPQVLGTVTDDALRRVAALARTLSETVVHEGLSLGTLDLAQARLNVVSNTHDEVRDIFWALAAEIHPDLVGKKLELRPDWTLVERRKPKPRAELLAIFSGGAGGTSDGGGLAEMLEQEERLFQRPSVEFGRRDPLHEDFNCGNPNCRVHGTRNRNGNGRHPATRKRVPVGARA